MSLSVRRVLLSALSLSLFVGPVVPVAFGVHRNGCRIAQRTRLHPRQGAACGTRRRLGHQRKRESPQRPASTLLGDWAFEPHSDFVRVGRSVAFRFNAVGSGSASAVHVYIASPSAATAVVVALYNDTAGRPGYLLTTGTRSRPALARWNTVSVRPARLNAGTTYWLAVLGTGGTLRYRDRRSGPCRSDTSAQTNVRVFPSSWSTETVHTGCPISAYVTGPAAGPTLPASTLAPTVTASNSGGSTPVTSSPSAVVAATVTPPGMPEPLPPVGSSTCTITVSSSAAAASAVASAAGGSVICLTAGTYPGFAMSGTHSSDVTVQPLPGATVTIKLNSSLTDGHGNNTNAVFFPPRTSHVILHGFYVTGQVEIDAGLDGTNTSYIRIDHNDITGGNEGVYIFGESCTAPHSPSCGGSVYGPNSNIMISGNRIHDIGTGADDAININNWARVRVSGNEITGILEMGDHDDCLQSTFGGTGLTFDRNYEHDNNCQGFFVKDGDATNVTLYDNLFLRDRAEGLQESNIQVYDTHNLIIRNNTNWSGNGDTLRAPDGISYTAAVDYNVSQVFNDGCCSESVFQLTETYNIFGQADWTFNASPTDAVEGSPQFVGPAQDDYRLANNPNNIGIDWRPADQHYGP